MGYAPAKNLSFSWRMCFLSLTAITSYTLFPWGVVHSTPLTKPISTMSSKALGGTLSSKDTSKNISQERSTLNLTETYTDLYTLGPGDGLNLVFLDPELRDVGGGFAILMDGTAILPFIGSVQLAGLTIGQASRWLTSLYEKQIVRPQLLLQLTSPRPTKITVIGEVTKPGFFEMSGIPRIVNAVQMAGGITANADIRKVMLRRVVGQDGAQKQTFLDLSQIFFMGNQFQNPILFDGDTIIVGRATEPLPDEIIRIGRTNLAPLTITVSILGEVKAPGTIGLPANTPLMEAIFRAGGLAKWRANKNHIELIRFNDNGTTTRQVFSYKQDLNVSNGFNPPLRDRDTIIVNRSFYGEAIDALNDLAVPIGIVNNLGGIGNNWGWNNNR
ncbi:MAG: polysaccharide biosynthesis/export family protein [Cyanobacteriota bacterium]|nr:polysaccharide biosynthesis/export family protein [Cyanobacteriota bacterium]